MALRVDDLIAPTGEIELAFFPGEGAESVEARIAAALQAGYAKAASVADPDTQDTAALAWAYSKVYQAVVALMSRQPIAATINDVGARSHVTQQIDTFKQLSLAWRQQFDAIVPQPDVPVGRPLPTIEIPNQFTF